MSYRDPYEQSYPSRQQNRNQYQEYASDFNPYATSQQPHQTYDQGGPPASYDNYGANNQDESEQQTHPQRAPSKRTFAAANLNLDQSSPAMKGKESADVSTFSPITPRPRTTRAIKDYRYDHRGPLWTKGGRGRCFGRFCCCTLMTAFVLIVSIFLALALWIRPPNIEIGKVETQAQSGSAIELQENGIKIHLGVNITVNNPNYFDVNFRRIKAEVFYPINNTAIGQGSADNVVFKNNAQTNWTFPFTIDYQTTRDPQALILRDLANKCGVNGAKSNISVNYKITLGLRILFITISPVVSNSFTFMCPLDASDLEGLIKSTGIGGLLG